MTKNEFIEKLRKKLDILEKSEIEDIIEEYEGYIDEKKASGMSEQEAVSSLGNINEIAKDLLSAYKIKEDYQEKSQMNSINTFVDSIISGIDSFIEIFKGKSNKEIARIIVEIILLFIVIALFNIPFVILKYIGYDTFMVFSYRIGDVLYQIWRFILDIIYFGLAIIFFFRVLKEKIVERNLGESKEEIKVEKIKTKEPKIKEEKKHESHVKVKEEKTNDTDLIGIFANIFLFFVKCIVAILAICNALYIVGLSAALVIVIYFLIKGVTYYGILLLIVALLLFGITIFEALLKFIFDKKNNGIKFIIGILTSLILGGVGMGVFATEIAQSTFIDEMRDGNVNIITDTIKVEDKLVIPEYYDVKIDDSLKDELKVEYTYYVDYLNIKINPYTYHEHGYSVYHPSIKLIWSKKTFNGFIEDAKNKTFYDYSNLVDITIYMSKENYNKMTKDLKEYYDSFKPGEYDEELHDMEEDIEMDY